MARMIAIGVGCRKACASAAIIELVQRALADCQSVKGDRRLFSLVDKSEEPGLRGAAEALGYDLVFLSHEALAAAAPRILKRSAGAERRFGLPSVAEAAALAGAGPDSELMAPRLAAKGATCAIAYVREERTAGDARSHTMET
jgi:cobalt-precorrin 5A hydrolase